MRNRNVLMSWSWSLLWLGATSSLGEAQGPDTLVIPSTITCASCRIVLTRVATLGGRDDPMSPFELQNSVARDSRGRYYVAPMADIAKIGVYDVNGRFLKALGRSGQGPGEYDYIVQVQVKADSVLVLDQGLRRLTVLAPDHTFVRSVTLEGTLAGVAPLADGSLLVDGTSWSPSHAGHPLFHFATDGKLLRAFGGDGAEVRLDRPQTEMRRVTAIRGGSAVLAARLDRYQIEHWRADGTLLRTFRRNATWYEPWTDYTVRPTDILKPKPMTMAVWEDSAGLIWTVNRVAIENWKPTRQDVRGREPRMPAFEQTDSNIDTMIEVIDPVTGRLLASQRFPQYMQALISQGLLYSFRAVDDDLRVDVWRASLNGHK